MTILDVGLTYAQFVREYYSRIFKIVRTICVQDGYTWDPADHADICQELLILFERVEPWVRYPSKFESLSWIYPWVRFYSRRWLRDQRRQWHAIASPLYPAEPIVEAPVEPQALDYWTELSQLPPTAQRVLQLKLQSYSDAETRGITGLSAYHYETTLDSLKNHIARLHHYRRRGRARRACTGKQPKSTAPVYCPPFWA